eukprot:m.256382 g.256382  ORF g.256382 m.256382 type:complete len:130 (+) comp26570_c0_seq15:5030-5419(+)
MRKDATALTAAMRQQYETRRRHEQQRLAQQILRMVGIRRSSGRRFLLLSDMQTKEKTLCSTFADLVAWYTSAERALLFQNNTPLAVAIVRVVLGAAGYKIEDRMLDEDRRALFFSKAELPAGFKAAARH